MVVGVRKSRRMEGKKKTENDSQLSDSIWTVLCQQATISIGQFLTSLGKPINTRDEEVWKVMTDLNIFVVLATIFTIYISLFNLLCITDRVFLRTITIFMIMWSKLWLSYFIKFLLYSSFIQLGVCESLDVESLCS